MSCLICSFSRALWVTRGLLVFHGGKPVTWALHCGSCQASSSASDSDVLPLCLENLLAWWIWHDWWSPFGVCVSRSISFSEFIWISKASLRVVELRLAWAPLANECNPLAFVRGWVTSPCFHLLRKQFNPFKQNHSFPLCLKVWKM